jgi:PHS family inorganic phosphate transporter-like MFS transporter
MPAAVFCCQSLGSLAANMVALIAVAGFHHRLLEDDSGAGCTGRCVQDVDRIWRLIVGLGAVPEFIALWFRLTTIGSPRYTAEVTQNSLQAAADVSYFFRPDEAIPAPEMGQITATIVISPATTEPVLYPSSVNSTRSSVSEVTPTVDVDSFWVHSSSFLFNLNHFEF